MSTVNGFPIVAFHNSLCTFHSSVHQSRDQLPLCTTAVLYCYAYNVYFSSEALKADREKDAVFKVTVEQKEQAILTNMEAALERSGSISRVKKGDVNEETPGKKRKALALGPSSAGCV